MTPTPKVTIILPVYNVEPYLRQCLDSVVNQTMRDIQIICVNDGATDGSPAILEEYATKDPRIEIVHQKNLGGGAARNAAYPYMRGKYTYFADPDDWLELDLCQQCWDKAEATKADIVSLRHVEYTSAPVHTTPYNKKLPEIRQSPEEKYETLRVMAPWRRFWQTKFLLSNNIRFSEGKRPNNDVLASWKGTVLANHIAVLDKPLYHYRFRPGSYQSSQKEKIFIIVETFCDVKTMLHETGLYDLYKDFFFAEQLRHYSGHYRHFPPSLRPKFLERIRQYWSEEDREFCRTAPKKLLPRHIRAFCKMIDGGPMSMVNYHVSLALYDFTELITRIAKMSPSLIVQKIVKRTKRLMGQHKK